MPNISDGFDDDFDDMEDIDNIDNADTSDGFDDGFDDIAPPVKTQRQSPPPAVTQVDDLDDDENIDAPQDTEWAPPENEEPSHKGRMILLSAVCLVLLFCSAWCTGYAKNGFMPKDILDWKIFGGASLADMFKLHKTEELLKPDENIVGVVLSETDEVKEVTDAERYPDLLVSENATFCTVVGYTGKDKTVILPETYNGKKCTGIGNNAFAGLSVTDIQIPEGYETIGQSAFAECSLTDLRLPSTIKELGWGMCADCKGLESVTIPYGIEKISDWAFSGCRKLNNVVLPDSVTAVGEWAFNYCVSMTDITLSKNLQNIAGYGFYDCRSLEALELPEGMLVVGDMAFRSCAGLLIVQLPDTITSIGNSAFMNCNEKLILVGSADSVTAKYAKKNELNFSEP